RRMLLDVRASNEAMRGLAAYVSTHNDISHHHEDEAVRQASDDIVALLIPVVKAYFTDRGFKNVSDAMQVCGGAGYTRDWSIEQYLRDMRIALIYEGTNHIQALDLVGRKLPMASGRLFKTFLKEVKEAIAEGQKSEATKPFADDLESGLGMLVRATEELGARAQKDREEVGALASTYLHLFGLVACAFSWVKQTVHAVSANTDNRDTKLKTARYFFARVYPEVHGVMAQMKAGKDTMMSFSVDEL
ncbi:MAG: acyl-CoA dehydrogenase C-terminal domain-containing protein, partial [Myxococcota bacterium]